MHRKLFTKKTVLLMHIILFTRKKTYLSMHCTPAPLISIALCSKSLVKNIVNIHLSHRIFNTGVTFSCTRLTYVQFTNIFETSRLWRPPCLIDTRPPCLTHTTLYRRTYTRHSQPESHDAECILDISRRPNVVLPKTNTLQRRNL